MSATNRQVPRHLRPIANRWRAAGGTIELSGGGHLVWRLGGKTVITGSTPKQSGHAAANAIKSLERILEPPTA